MTPTRGLGLLLAAAALAIDQASKHWLLFSFGLADRQPVRLGPFADLILRWNRGISYSLFTSDGTTGRLVLLAVTLTATAALAVWLWRTGGRWTAGALGLLIGGALGNAYDRFAYGAVVDFVHLHVDGFSWYVFNGADVAITLGVILLLYDGFLAPQLRPASKMP